VRAAVRDDIPALTSLLEAYMAETYDRPWSGSQKALEQDLGGKVEAMLAFSSIEESVGFASWFLAYDLHHCVSGGEVIDMFVRPAHRGRGAAPALLAAVAAAVQQRGGCYLRGQAVARPATRRLYDRVAVLFPGAECNVSGRAFRTIAALSGQSPREIARNLPDKSLNYER
jgi:GNAT superfamily N-acetyltransferase